MLAAAVLMVLHLGAFFQADDIIMREIPGSHPYLTGLGILGGMYSFDNPLQGEANSLCFAPYPIIDLLPVFRPYPMHASCCYSRCQVCALAQIMMDCVVTGISALVACANNILTACAGALLGPMLLSMLSVFYNLHAKLFRDEAPSSERHYTGSHRATI